MSNDICCEDMEMLLEDHDIFMKKEDYGWVLHWREVVQEKGQYSRVNNYGIKINYCPMCGEKLE